jgi:DsbC/DsbD-like thiol-disulfide interchange protein
MRKARLLAAGAVIALASAAASAQALRPKAEIVPTAPATVIAGRESTLTLTVKLPGSIHVQADKPRDPALIPTVLTLDPPAGVSVARIEYPKPEDLVQAGQSTPLAVFGPTFTIAVTVNVAAGIAGPLTIPGTLRYQACDTNVCYPPAKASVTWTTTAGGA